MIYMKKFINITLVLVALLMAAAPGYAQVVGNSTDDVDPDKLVNSPYDKDIDEPIDSATMAKMILEAMKPDSVNQDSVMTPYYINALLRAYDDKVVLRWAPNEYVPWHVLNSAGYQILRFGYGDKKLSEDTLAIVNPWPIEKFKQTFAKEDSLAGVAVQLVYGGAQGRFGQTAATTDDEAIMEIYDEQQSVVGMAIMVSELRPDLAEAMGLKFVDRTAEKDMTYTYIIRPNLPDSVISIESAAVLGVKLGQWKPEPLDVTMIDSLMPPSTVMVYWTPGPYSAYDIERQDKEGGEWRKLNERPYVMLVAEGKDQPNFGGLNMFQDPNVKIGTYSYRITGYDSVGDKTLPSAPHQVTVPDLIPHRPPLLKNIVVDHPDKEHAYATIYFHVDTVEADVKGYLPLYRHGRIKNGEWHPLTMDFTAPGDSVMRVDVSGLPTGQLSIAAYDNAGNQGASLPQMILLEDYMPPSAPTNLRANVFPDGYLELRWTPSPESDVAYYEVWFANDSTHVFMNMTSDQQTDTVFIDSLSLGLNQAFIYYKVRAVDYAGNSSPDSKMLQVARPNNIPPSVCRADSVWMTDDEINIWWAQSGEIDLDYHRLFRKLENEELRTLVGVYKADSVRNYGNDIIRIKDAPLPNMRQRYVYAMETFNLTGVTSGLSQVQTFLFRGPRILDIPLKLSSGYDAEKHESKLAWETGKVPDYRCEWYYCVYRKGPDDKDFQFMLSTKNDDPAYNDFLLRKGQKAEYYVTVQYEDGRRSRPSNVVTITAPKE